MVYVTSWDEFVERSVQLFRADPHSTRYVMKYRHCDGKLVLKVTDDHQINSKVMVYLQSIDAFQIGKTADKVFKMLILLDPCEAHCTDLVLQDFEKISIHEETIPKFWKITTCINLRISLISLLQHLIKGKDLARLGITPFATSYLTITLEILWSMYLYNPKGRCKVDFQLDDFKR
uniref:Signal recognition particle 9 kDa protein n=1 Tax=Cajanus cajan TaxID=3821 RepID=A0A151S391_CAJCA|nr:Signal recognition particle 9 kDa protein [Cajanus cajan]